MLQTTGVAGAPTKVVGMADAVSGRLLKIRGADPREAERLREIAIASKSAWGYDLERVRDWAAGLDFSPERLRTKEFYVAEFDGRIVGWAALIPHEACWLDDLWIEPDWFSRGIGTRLFQHAAERGRVLGATRMNEKPSRAPAASTKGWAGATCATASQVHGDAATP